MDNDHILVFDNGVMKNASRVLELDPLLEEIIWEYKGDPPGSFFTRGRGGNQPLPNGNVLITESNEGHVFEVTREGEIVWEFFNPDINHFEKKRAAIYRMMRITDIELIEKLEITVT